MARAPDTNSLLAPFRHRSGRVIAVGRLSLAGVFFAALLLDPDWQSDGRGAAAIYLMAGYVLASALLLAAIWNSWWWDHRLAGPAHVADTIVFGAVVVLTHGYTSPFYTFSVFLILSPTIRWSWRETLLTAAAVSAIFFLGGLYAAFAEGLPLEVDRVVVRTTYLLVLSLLLIWFAITQESPRITRSKNAEQLLSKLPARTALEFVLEQLPAERAYLIWWEADEPWVHVLASTVGATAERYGPEQFGDNLGEAPGDKPLLFETARNRALSFNSRGRPRSRPMPDFLLAALPAAWGLTTGLVIRIRASHYSGEVILDHVPGLCRDDLKEAERLGDELSNLFDRYSALSLSAEGAVQRAKVSLSRDLHDSVLQSLSGASFRLEALRSWIRAGRSADEQITTIQEQILQEQRNVRSFINQLQNGESSNRDVDIGDSLQDLMTELSQQWDLDCRITLRGTSLTVPGWIEHPLMQIVREATANSVRHANAKRIECELWKERDTLLLNIRDDGGGFALQGEFDEPALRKNGLTPWSIYERTKGLGGSVSLFSNKSGSQLRLELPIRAAA